MFVGVGLAKIIWFVPNLFSLLISKVKVVCLGKRRENIMFFRVSSPHALSKLKYIFILFPSKTRLRTKSSLFWEHPLSTNSLLIAFDKLHNIHLYTYIYIVSTYLMEISEYTLSVSCCVLAMRPCSILLQTIILCLVMFLFVLLWYYRF